MSFRELLGELEQEDELIHMEEEIFPKYEIAAELEDSKDPLLFENVKNHEMNVAGNIYGARELIARGLGIEKDEIIESMRKALSKPVEPKKVPKGPVQEVVETEVDLNEIPILTHFEKDGGPYVTSSVLIGKDSHGVRNLSFHRMLKIDQNKFTLRLVPRDLNRMFKDSEAEGEDLEVAAAIGVGPEIALAAATSPAYGEDEYGIAGNLSDELELTDCESIDLEVPARAEMVLEGKLLARERAPEGPFADITGTYDAVRQQPVFKVERITRREDAIYQALLPGSSEHKLLMGTPREPVIFEEVDKVAKAKNVVLTDGGCGWLHGIVSIEKDGEDEGRKTIEAAYRGHSSLKHVVVVDDDIDIYDSKEVEWAIATRARADRDTIIKSDVEGSSLDPTADPETRLGSKMGIDATKHEEDPGEFERAYIPK